MINEEVMPWRRVRCYESKINPLEDEVEPNLPDESRDQHLLKLFIDIINYSLTPSGKRRCSSSSSKLNIYFLVWLILGVFLTVLTNFPRSIAKFG